ncbi:MAG: hypothetical protein V3U51_06360, partial [Thermoplasmata archaeon]
MKLTKALVKDAFSRKTFERGYNYFKEGYVTQGIDFQDRIWGMVAGSRPQPYRVLGSNGGEPDRFRVL